jgi:hypothetical protein
MSHVWTWVHANPGFTTILLLSALIATYILISTISNHILLGWKAFFANSAPQEPDDDDSDDEGSDDERIPSEETRSVDLVRSPQSSTDTGKHPTRFDRINNS